MSEVESIPSTPASPGRWEMPYVPTELELSAEQELKVAKTWLWEVVSNAMLASIAPSLPILVWALFMWIAGP